MDLLIACLLLELGVGSWLALVCQVVRLRHGCVLRLVQECLLQLPVVMLVVHPKAVTVLELLIHLLEELQLLLIRKIVSNNLLLLILI